MHSKPERRMKLQTRHSVQKWRQTHAAACISKVSLTAVNLANQLAPVEITCRILWRSKQGSWSSFNTTYTNCSRLVKMPAQGSFMDECWKQLPRVFSPYLQYLYLYTHRQEAARTVRGGGGLKRGSPKGQERSEELQRFAVSIDRELCTVGPLRSKRPLVLTASQAHVHGWTWSRMWHSTEDDVTKFHAQLLYLKKKKAPTAPPADPSTSIPTPRPARAPVHREGVQLSQAQE